MKRLRSLTYRLVLLAFLAAACERLPADAVIIARAHAPLDRARVEAVIGNGSVALTLSKDRMIVDRSTIRLGARDCERLREQFARALSHPPPPTSEVPPLDGVSFGISLRTQARMWQTDIRGRLTDDEHEAFTHLNSFLPATWKFDIDGGFRARKH
jgi:hypothetical protein